MAYLDEAGFAMTLPVCYSWFPIGERLCIPYEAPQGRRVNAIGAYFSDGPLAGRFVYQTWASLPPHARNAKRKTAEQVAHDYGLTLDEIGPIDAVRLLAFFWHIADRPADAGADWKRERPLMIVLDNYSVHKSQTIQEAVVALEAADIFLVYLPSYSPELSKIEPIWNDVKHHYLTKRSYEQVDDLKRATDTALADKAADLLKQHESAAEAERVALNLLNISGLEVSASEATDLVPTVKRLSIAARCVPPQDRMDVYHFPISVVLKNDFGTRSKRLCKEPKRRVETDRFVSVRYSVLAHFPRANSHSGECLLSDRRDPPHPEQNNDFDGASGRRPAREGKIGRDAPSLAGT